MSFLSSPSVVSSPPGRLGTLRADPGQGWRIPDRLLWKGLPVRASARMVTNRRHGLGICVGSGGV